MKQPPWKRPNPAGKTKSKLSPAQVEAARERAAAAGRRYPNLVDNMWAAKQDAASLTGNAGGKSDPSPLK
ncbi:hypothetical protein [Stenotrophobium rhamnosiphilum]|uniref:Uncharacterized protein n=1 Tax=Stenotrophobium rhamnosiphilum TaxID=2029166 RepID=A0A2T5MK95_9GAMM|nr:hypothetical protein [Stenotrophobium rhamnosiphilum]PTU32990.1 hypothetical protein CJD38_02430 [Stenotrophobium rhamnosiphilum]